MATTKKVVIVVITCLSALLFATGGNIRAGDGDTPGERPFRIHGEARVLIDWTGQTADVDGRPFVPWVMTAAQLSTEGWSTNEAEGKLYLDTMISEGVGIGTELSGDTIEWHASEVFGTQHVTVTFTGGTGRYEHAHGGFAFDYTIVHSEVDEEGNPGNLTYTFWGIGSINH